jgi:hypothetical protein
MADTVVLLTCDSGCGQAHKIAQSILRGYGGEVRVYDYNYRNGHLYRYRVNQQGLNVTDMGRTGDSMTWHEVCRGLKLGQGNQGMNQSIAREQLVALGKLTRQTDGMTTLDMSRIPQDWLRHAGAELNEVSRALDSKNNTLCFMIAPNPRNVPLRLQTFGHKLFSVNQCITYRKKGNKGTFVPVVETREDAVASVTELAFCRHIITSRTLRFVGNCYGAQIMWLAMGGGLTSFKRNPGSSHQQSMVVPGTDTEQIDRPLGGALNVTWQYGITAGDRDQVEPIMQSTYLTGWDPITYNTDYFHSCMMILSKDVSDVIGTDGNEYTEHPFATVIANYGQVVTDEFLVRLRRYSNKNRYQGQQKTWEWVGEYHFYQGRISGFQGHPLLHLDIQHEHRDETIQYMREQMFST